MNIINVKMSKDNRSLVSRVWKIIESLQIISKIQDGEGISRQEMFSL